MLLLVTDTSGRNGSVALVRADGDTVQMLESVPLTGGTFSAQLVPQIAELLAKQGFHKSQIDAFVVVSGPGSFTGLRVGLAAIKALAEILGKPIAPVSLLEVMAQASGEDGRVLTLMDAGRGDCYVGEYEVAEGATRLIREQLVPKEHLREMADGASVVTADSGLGEMLKQPGAAVHLLEAVDSEMIARLGWKKLQENETVAPDRLDANYIRRDTEIFAKPASGS